jgi:hypothetical protein
MGFWDEYVDEGGGAYVTADEKASLIENQVAFQIVKVEEDDENQYQGKSNPRFLATVLLPNPLTGDDEERFIGFAKASPPTTRDRMLEALVEYLDDADNQGEPVLVQMEKFGNFIALKKAE